MYATVNDMRLILPASVTVGDANLGTPSPGQTNVKRDKLTPTQCMSFIGLASQEIDSRLRELYVTPLRRVNTFETEILENVTKGTNVNIRVWDSSVFVKGETVRLQSKSIMESSTVYDTSDVRYVQVSSVMYTYPSDESKICILKFPDPISIIAARLAVSYAFDQLFSAEQAPDISAYGKEQRKLALNSIDSILSGTVLLLGQDHTGRRFVRGSVFDSYSSPEKDFQFGREKST